MFSIMTNWMKSNSKSRKARRAAPRVTLSLSALEAREVPAVLHADLVNAFNAGTDVARTAANAAGVVSTFASDVPVLKEDVASVAKLADQFTAAFAKLNEAAATAGSAIAGVDAEFQNLAKQIQDTVPGSTVTRFSLTPDAGGDLVRIKYHFEKAIDPQSFSAGGDKNGFSFFDDAVNGKIQGSLSSDKSTFVVDVDYGVDLVNGVPTFYVAEGSKLALNKLHIAGDAKGELAIRSLASVSVSGKLDANVQGNVSLVDNKDGTADKRVRVSALASSAVGDLTGTSVTLGTAASPITFSAKVPVFGTITWTGQFAGSFTGTNFSVDTANTKLNAPDPVQVLKQAVTGVIGSFAGDNLPLLSGGLKSVLSGNLPDLGSINILHELGLDTGSLSFNANATSVNNATGANPDVILTAIKNALPAGFELLPGKTLTFDNAKAAVDDLINGKYVDLVRYTISGERNPLQASQTLPPVTFPILPPALTATISLGLEEKAGVKYFVGVGFDTTGLYIDPRTNLSLSGSIQLTAEATAKLFGIAGVGISIGAGASLDGGVKFNDPDPTDGKIYLDEVFDPNKSVADNLANSMTFFADANLSGSVRLKLAIPFLPDITLAEKEYRGQKLFSTASDKTVQSTTGQASFRKLALVPTQILNVDSLINANGVLAINAAADANGANVQLSQENGNVKVIWFGRGVGTATKAVTKVVFTGTGLADRLESSDTFSIPIQATGGDGNDQFTGGAAADILDGGNGSDILIGNAGNDTLKAGAGFNTVRGGDGNDIITAGDDGNALFGNDGADNITTGAGSDQIDGGADNDIINAGNGANVVFGGDGNDKITAGVGKDVLDGGLGNDTIDAGDGDDLLIGGDGADTLRAGVGNDRLVGDAGADRLEGGAGNDVLRGGADNDTLIGNAGDDILAGGTGLDTEFGDDTAMLGAESGRDSFEIDFNDADSLNDVLRGGPERDVITISGGVDAVTNAEKADDILIAPTATAGVFSAGRRGVGSTAARQTVFFKLTTDIENVIVRAGDGNDRIEVAESMTTGLSVDGGLGDDTILGGGGNDLLYGNAGNDTIDGRGGNDTIYGDGDNGAAPIPIVTVAAANEGNDTLQGGAGNDAIYGNGGQDRIDGGLLRDFVYGGKGNDILLNTGDGFGDEMDGGEDDDVIVGGAGADLIRGGDGSDTVLGGDGGDDIDGGEGADTLVGETGRDVISGGGGNDTLKAFLDNSLRATLGAIYQLVLPALTAPATQAEASTLSAPLETERTQFTNLKIQVEAQQAALPPDQQATLQPQLTLISNHLNDLDSRIQDLRLYATNLTDTLRGDAGNDTLVGSPYNDSLNGGADADTLQQSDLGQFGGDLFNGDTGDDVFVILGTALADAITLESPSDGIVNVFGNGGVLLGSFGSANQAAFLGIENVRIDAGDGDDTISLSGLGNRVPVTGSIQVTGGNGNDTINAAGYNGPTVLNGGNGSDVITGGLVDDLLFGGDGADTLDGGTGNDTIYGDNPVTQILDKFGRIVIPGSTGGIGNDTIRGGAGNDTIYAGAGDDTVDADPSLGNPGSGNDVIYGGDGNDTITAGFGSDYVDGEAGNDLIRGDTFLTAAGAATDPDGDTLIGGLGADTLYGSGGSDLLIGNALSGANDGSVDILDGGVGADTARVSYIGPKETLIGIETLDVARAATTAVLVRNDFSIVAVELGGNVYVGGVLSADHATDVQQSPDGKVLYIQTTADSLVGFTASGKRTVMMTNIDSFTVQPDGRVKVVQTKIIKSEAVTVTTTLNALAQ
ncbi:calcium-binding protein [Limnoglobus roseus]|nr:calcium-binding protein [Limnoglobus roseus]